MKEDVELLKAELTAMRMLLRAILSSMPPEMLEQVNEKFRINYLRGRFALKAQHCGSRALAAYVSETDKIA